MSKKADNGVAAIGQVYKVQTLVDGGIRLTIDLPESAVNIMGQLAQYQLFGVVVSIAIKPDNRSEST